MQVHVYMGMSININWFVAIEAYQQGLIVQSMSATLPLYVTTTEITIATAKCRNISQLTSTQLHVTTGKKTKGCTRFPPQ